MLGPSIALPTLPGGHPRAAVNFFTEDPVERGQFEILCDRACTPVDVCPLFGANATILATVTDRADIAEFLFRRQFPALTICRLTVESRGDNAVRITGLSTSSRLTNLLPNAVQPTPMVTTGGSTIQ